MPDVRENDPVQMCCQGQVHETCMRGAGVACEKGNKDEKSGKGKMPGEREREMGK